MDLCLQVAGDGDVRPMLAIYAPYVRDTAITFEYEVPTAAEFGARLHQVLPAYPWLVCRAPGQVLGYAYAHRHMERAAYGWNVECSVYVLGSARGHGVGRALYGALLELLRLPFPGGIRGFLKGFLLPDYPFLLFRHGFVILLALCRR